MTNVMQPLDLFMKPKGSPRTSVTVGVSGRAGSGKDTFCTMLQRKLEAAGHSAEIMGFADPIRMIAAKMGFSLQRELKEVVVTKSYADLSATLFDAIEDTLGSLLDDNTRAHLYATAFDYIQEHLVVAEADDFTEIECSPRTFMQVFGTEIGQAVDKLIWCKVLFSRAARSICDYVLVPDLRFPHEMPYVDHVVFIDRDVPAVAGHVSESHFDAIRDNLDTVLVNNNSGLWELDNCALAYVTLLENDDAS